MATSKLTLYGGGLQTFSRRLRQFSSMQPKPTVVYSSDTSQAVAPTFNVNSAREENFPMPGRVATHSQYSQLSSNALSMPSYEFSDVDVLTTQLDHDRHVTALSQFGEMSASAAATDGGQQQQQIVGNDTLECMALDAPELVRKEFADLFPNRSLSESNCTIVTLTQKTENDMDAWTPQMEAERDQLTVQFIDSASQICDALRKDGFWADFIDPSSGRPYLGPFTNATLFETDSRYRHLGVRVEDLGCCKVIEHVLWGRRAFVGTLFTNAPMQSEAMQRVLSYFH